MSYKTGFALKKHTKMYISKYFDEKHKKRCPFEV